MPGGILLGHANLLMVNLRFNRFRFGVGASQRIRSNQFLDDEVVEVFQLVDELGLLARSLVRRARRSSPLVTLKVLLGSDFWNRLLVGVGAYSEAN